MEEVIKYLQEVQEEYSDNPYRLLAILDYWIGSLFIIRSNIEAAESDKLMKQGT